MYAAHFNLREPPFSIAPDPSFLYLSAGHQEALGHLLYGTGQYGGFVQLTGEVGTGKTTIVRSLLAQKLDDVDVAMIHNPRQSELEFVASICDELGVQYARPATSIKLLVDALNEHLLKIHANGRRTVLIIDEAQNLAPAVLEQVRLLTNLETDKEKLLRIMLIGQPELDVLLERPDLRQLASRITARARLAPLLSADTERYIVHRLRVAGGAADLFTAAAIRRVHRYTRGIPRLINIVCDRAMLGAYAKGLRTVTPEVVQQAANEALGLAHREPAWRRGLARLRPQQVPLIYVEGVLAVATLIVAAVIAVQLLSGHRTLKPTQASVGEAAAELQKAVPAAVAPPPASVLPAPQASAEAPTKIPTQTSMNAPVDADIGALRATAQPLSAVVARLISLWDDSIQIPQSENVCHALAAQKLACYRGHGTWDDLKQIDRPAILTLQPADGEIQHVLLRALGDEDAVLDTASGPLRMSKAQLTALWNGEFLVLWRKNIGDDLIGLRTHGEGVLWLRARLAQAEGRTPPRSSSDKFDSELRKSLIRFQAAHGLDADGQAGVRSLMALADVDRDANTPTLHDADQDSSSSAQ